MRSLLLSTISILCNFLTRSDLFLRLSLIFGAGMNWMTALIITFLAGVGIGLALKMKMAWYAFLVGNAVLVVIIGLIAGLFGSMMG